MPLPGSRTTVVFMHHLGGSAETWAPVDERLRDRFPTVRLDLPGFGDAAHENGRPVAGMADWVLEHVRERVDGPWVLVGHSMSAKVALLVARRLADAPPSPSRLVGLVLAAGSPPAPEPMEDEKRAEMLGWFAGDAARSREEAHGFVAANVAAELDAGAHEAALGDVLRTSRHAWRHWLEAGSLEDLREPIGEVAVPALVLAGAEDEALGHAIQLEQMMPHLPAGRLETVAGAAHLLPLEQPDAVATLMAAFIETLEHQPDGGRWTRRTASLLQRRGASDQGYRPQVLDENGLAVLRRLVQHVLPMPDGIRMDLAAKLDAKLAEAVGDGWRFAVLPPDAEAYRQATETLDRAAREQHGVGFAALGDAAIEALAGQLSSGELSVDGGPLSAEAMQSWFGDVRGDSCQLFLTHPAVQRRANVLATATGDDRALHGFTLLGANENEEWEDHFWREHV